MYIDKNSGAASLIRRPPIFHKDKRHISFYFNDIECKPPQGYHEDKVFNLKNLTLIAVRLDALYYVRNTSIGNDYEFYINMIYPHSSSSSPHRILRFKNKKYYRLCTGSYSIILKKMLNEGKIVEAIYYLYDFFSEYNPGSLFTGVDTSYKILKNKKRCCVCKKYNPYINWFDWIKDVSLSFEVLEKYKNIAICDIDDCYRLSNEMHNISYEIYDKTDAEIEKIFLKHLRRIGAKV